MTLPTLSTLLNWALFFFAGSGVCSLISTFTPSVHKNTFAQWLLDGMNLWAFNTGKASNKDDAR